MKKNKVAFILLLIFIVIFMSSCSNNSDKAKENTDKSLQMVRNIEDFETKIVDIMMQVDLVPYYKSQIKEKKKEEKKEEKKAAQNKQGNTEQKTGGSKGKFKPKPITENDTLLLEILKEEKNL